MANKFNAQNFETEVLNSDIPVMIDFYADWCGPCKMMGPIVEKLASEYDGKVKIGKINVDEEPDLAGKYNIMSIPSFLFIKGGTVADKTVGGMQKEDLATRLDKLL
ncbi:MAG: thioredoxin [Lachnospiraceae bacterium]|jgi:thioredoxin 1|nr:thioredoxin [Lachnospiraceae bacterium]